jgi:small-conductance mechanosensitive channel
MRLLWVAWFPVFFITILMAWGAKNAVLIGFFRVINYPIPIGDMRFNLMGVAFSALMLLLTHLSTQLWRRMLRDRFLSGSGMDTGLKDSITTITIYLIWAIGIFISLRMIGVSSTSLTVVFGALSIGLGFGLQNIFNNFISGIILLFERPIQVGDAVEIGGVWGVVQKINVRSTLVQTYDNASLIIPNSEFISNKVINWSFKDHRIRRVITVGVAYGSDTELVSATLKEIAGKTQWVLKTPEPDVLFSDFGDSSLIFKLRVWTQVDRMIKVETNLRFEIDRLFRERHIEIPFPQRDIHIK